MPTLDVSPLVKAWFEDARDRKPGLTDDDVARSLIGLPARGPSGASAALLNGGGPGQPVATDARGSVPGRQTFATRRLSSYVSGNQLLVGFAGALERRWSLPARSDKARIRTIRDQAVEFAASQGATIGQQNAVKKTLTEAGFHLVK